MIMKILLFPFRAVLFVIGAIWEDIMMRPIRVLIWPLVVRDQARELKRLEALQRKLQAEAEARANHKG